MRGTKEFQNTSRVRGSCFFRRSLHISYANSRKQASSDSSPGVQSSKNRLHMKQLLDILKASCLQQVW